MGNMLAVSLIGNILLLIGISMGMWYSNAKFELFIMWVGVLGGVIGALMLGGGQ